MLQQDLIQIQQALIARRKEILAHLSELENGWHELQERDIEMEEEAQKLTLAEAFDRLDERGKAAIEAIDLALSKIRQGSYGICESCEDPIALKRLAVLPTARLCLDCAREYEHKRHPLSFAGNVMEKPIFSD